MFIVLLLLLHSYHENNECPIRLMGLAAAMSTVQHQSTHQSLTPTRQLTTAELATTFIKNDRSALDVLRRTALCNDHSSTRRDHDGDRRVT